MSNNKKGGEKMRYYEYKVISQESVRTSGYTWTDPYLLEDRLNKLGKKGFKVVTIIEEQERNEWFLILEKKEGK